MAKAVSSGRAARSKKNGDGSGVENSPDTPTEMTSKRSTGSVEERIRHRAFELFKEAGEQHGRDQEHWFRAEAEIRGKTA